MDEARVDKGRRNHATGNLQEIPSGNDGLGLLFLRGFLFHNQLRYPLPRMRIVMLTISDHLNNDNSVIMTISSSMAREIRGCDRTAHLPENGWPSEPRKLHRSGMRARKFAGNFVSACAKSGANVERCAENCVINTEHVTGRHGTMLISP
jgi:hypothetical protein